jgi:hypothetical protein
LYANERVACLERWHWHIVNTDAVFGGFVKDKCLHRSF